jgi:hypothetical protein
VNHISLAHHTSGIVVISDMEAFANYFCFVKKQGHLVNDKRAIEEAQPSETLSEGNILEIDASVVVPVTSDGDEDI